MIASGKSQSYQNRGEAHKGYGKSNNGNTDSRKGKNGGDKKRTTKGVYEQEFRVWNNSRFLVLEDDANIEDTNTIHEEDFEGPIISKLQGRQKKGRKFKFLRPK